MRDPSLCSGHALAILVTRPFRAVVITLIRDHSAHYVRHDSGVGRRLPHGEMDAEGHPGNLSSDPGRDQWPSRSPDGSRIAFQSNHYWEIYVMNADGTEQVRLTDNDFKDSEPTWKPQRAR